MASKNNVNNEDSFLVGLEIDVEKAKKDFDNFIKETNAKAKKNYIQVPISANNSKTELFAAKETAKYTQQISDNVSRTVTITKEYQNAANKTKEELKKMEPTVKAIAGSYELSKNKLQEALSLQKQQVEYINKSSKATGEQRIAYEKMAQDAAKKLKTIEREQAGETTIAKILKENTTYRRQAYQIETAMANKKIALEVEQQKLAYLKEELPLFKN